MESRQRHAGRITLAFFLSAGTGLLMCDLARAEANPTQTFCGRLESAGNSSEHVTTLRLRPDKLLAGEYTFADGETETTGTLKEIPDNDGDPLTATLQWADMYGSGLLEIRFDSDYTSFDGKWGQNDEPPKNLWFGDPCK